MKWVSVAEAKTISGLRLVLAKGVWAAWSECTKNIFYVKKIPHANVAQVPFTENSEIVVWTGVRNQPQAIYNDEPVRTSWLDILNLAERLTPEPPLLPKVTEKRALVIGLSNELCGENGFGWCRRVQLGAHSGASGLRDRIMKTQYGAKDGDVSDEEHRLADILETLSRYLHAQKTAGSPYIVGDRVSAVDVYWATFSNLVKPLPADANPMADALRAKFDNNVPLIAGVLDPILFEHRDYIYKKYLQLPLHFG